MKRKTVLTKHNCWWSTPNITQQTQQIYDRTLHCSYIIISSFCTIDTQETFYKTLTMTQSNI